MHSCIIPGQFLAQCEFTHLSDRLEIHRQNVALGNIVWIWDVSCRNWEAQKNERIAFLPQPTLLAAHVSLHSKEQDKSTSVCR